MIYFITKVVMSALLSSGREKFEAQGWSIALATEEEIKNNADSNLTSQEKTALVMEHRRLNQETSTAAQGK